MDEADGEFDQSESCDEELIKDITIGKFYAVAYDKQWFIGKVSDMLNENQFKVKFLKSNNNHFVWPRQDDTDIVEVKYIFLSGSGPFNLRRHDLITIEKKFIVINFQFIFLKLIAVLPYDFSLENRFSVHIIYVYCYFYSFFPRCARGCIILIV